MLRKQIEDKHGKNWWNRKIKIDVNHVVKLCVRGIEEDLIRDALKCGVMYPHPEKTNRYVCVHKKSQDDYVKIIFVPGKNSNFIISGVQAKPEDIETYEKFRGSGNA